MSMKKIVGVVLLIAVFAVLICVTCAAYGWKCGLAIWGTAFGIALIICIAIFLIEESE